MVVERAARVSARARDQRVETHAGSRHIGLYSYTR
jgi:hypothetical protein